MPRLRRRVLLVITTLLAMLGLSIGVATAAGASSTPSLASCSDQLMIVGSRGDCVRSLQHNLNALGFGLAEDGEYGARTRLAVYYYQTWAGIQADGMAGPQTMSSLDLDANRPAPAGRGSIPAMPDEQAVFAPNGGGVTVNGAASSSAYFGRAATRQLNYAVNNATAGLATGAASAAFCKAVAVVWGPAGGLAGGLCSAGVALEMWNIQHALEQAVGACFEIKTHTFPTQYSEYLVNGGHNCIP